MSKRKIVILVLLIILIPAIYLLVSINKNVQLMQASYATAFNYPEYPIANIKDKTPDQITQIKKGEYLVKAGDCIACHTNTSEKGTAFAGGLAMQTPFGTIYTPNITSDKETGIGGWNDEQFIKAMHDGISPHGSPYYPAFPYLYFNMVSEEDLKAIKMYLDNTPAIRQANLQSKMTWPFNWRFMQYGWRLLFFNEKTGPFKSSPQQSEQWNRGAYLVEGLGHCAMCHTPSYYLLSPTLSLGAPIRKYNLTGAVVQGYLAPNITQTNLGGISDQEMVEIFTKARLLGGGNIQGPMLEAVHDSLSNLTTTDLIAITTYLKTVKSAMPFERAPDSSNVGQMIYNSYCSGCHASGIDGAPKFGDTGSWEPLVKSGMNKLYSVAISGTGNMPAKGMCYNCLNSDIRAAVDYMAAAAMKGAEQPVVIATKPSKLTSADGERIYKTNCSSCHDSGANNAPKLGDKEAWTPIVKEGYVDAYRNVMQGLNGHPARGDCKQCSDADVAAAVKYMLQKAAPDKNYILW